MNGMKNPSYQTCKKCHYQSKIPQKTDCLIGIWQECPKCGSEKWVLRENSLLRKVIETLSSVFK